MNESLQQLETKVENQGATPQGKVSAVEWNVLVAAVKQLDSSGINDESLKKYLQQYQYITKPELSGILEDAAPDLSGVVNTSGEQDVFGIKNFVTGLKLSNKLIRYDVDKNVFIFPGNILAEGGVAWNSSLDGFEPQTVTDAVNVDGVTIGRTTSGALTVLAGAGGGINKAQLADYLTNNNYAKKSDIPSLSGYATEAFVTSRGYITSAAIPTKVSTLDNDSGYITGITSSMVTSALGYTPYNAANFTKANIKSTLGISDWALASAKPSYAWTEITSRPTKVSAFTNDSGFITSASLPTKLSQFTDDVVKGNYLSTSGGTVNGALNMNAYFQLGNNKSITAADTDGVYQAVLYLSTANNLIMGYGTSVVGKRKTVLLGYKIEFKSAGNENTTLALNEDQTASFSSSITAGGNITSKGNVSARNVIANGSITADSIISFVDTDASTKIVLQRNSDGDILFCGGFADRNVYIDGSILRVRTEDTIFSRGISTTGVTLRSGDKSAAISYNASKNAFVFPANAIFEGGVAWNSPMDGTSAYASELERRIEALQTEVDTLKQTVQTLTA